MSHILVNVAWPYANGPRHIGHVAGFGVPSDVYARYERMKGNDVLMVSGTDEHGTPILVEADKEGVSAQELANRYNRVIAKDLCDLGLSYDLFTRTTTGRKVSAAMAIPAAPTVLFTSCTHPCVAIKSSERLPPTPGIKLFSINFVAFTATLSPPPAMADCSDSSATKTVMVTPSPHVMTFLIPATRSRSPICGTISAATARER